MFLIKYISFVLSTRIHINRSIVGNIQNISVLTKIFYFIAFMVIKLALEIGQTLETSQGPEISKFGNIALVK